MKKLKSFLLFLAASSCLTACDRKASPKESVILLATAQALPSGITLDELNVYWINRQRKGLFTPPSLMEVRKEGGEVNTVASLKDYPAPLYIVEDKHYFYWLTAQSLQRMPKAGKDVQTFASFDGNPNAFDSPGAMALDQTNIYWTAQGPIFVPRGSIMKMSKSGGPLKVLVSGQPQPNGIAVDATDVYWTDTKEGTIKKISKFGGVPVTLASDQNRPQAIVVDESNIYWVNWGRFGNPDEQASPTPYDSIPPDATSPIEIDGQTIPALVPKGVPELGGLLKQPPKFNPQYLGQGALMKLSKYGGDPIPLVEDQNRPVALAVDETNVYWVTKDKVMKIAKSSGRPIVIASDQINPQNVGVDSTYVYWSNEWDRSGPNPGGFANGAVKKTLKESNR